MNQPARRALLILIILSGWLLPASARAQEESPSPTPAPTPPLYSPQTMSELKRIQEEALKSDYAYRQLAHLCNNIGPRLTGSAQAQKAVDYVAAEVKALGCGGAVEKV